MKYFPKLRSLLFNHYTIVVFLMISLVFALTIIFTAGVGKKQEHHAIAVAVEEVHYKHKRDSVNRRIAAENKLLSSLAQKRSSRQPVIARALTQLDSLDQLHDQTYCNPSLDSAHELERFFTRYYDSAHTAHESEIHKRRAAQKAAQR